jgi:outer membrane protein
MKRNCLLFFIFMTFSIIVMAEPEENIKKDTGYILRPIYGRANYSKLRRTFHEADDWDEQGSYFSGIQVEKILLRDYKELPIDFTFLGSLFYHKQDINEPDGMYTQPIELNGEDTYQINFAIKVYYKKFPWSSKVKTRFGVGNGLSYVGEYLDIETQNFNSEGKEARSRLLNYMDISLSFNLGDVLKKYELKNCYAGVGVSHRSGIQGAIEGVRGGSNFATLFLEFEI